MAQNKIYRDMLLSEFQRRMAKNRAYSIRAYARDLGLSVSRLSETFSEKSGLSAASAKKIVNKMDWTSGESNTFIHSVLSCHARSALVRASSAKALEQNKSEMPKVFIQRDQFRLMSRWYFMAIPELLELDQFEMTAKSVASKLAITLSDAQEALWGLEKLGLIEKTENGWRTPSAYKVVESSPTPSEAIRSFHLQMLNKAETAIEQQSLDERDVSCVVLAMSEEDMPMAREMIKKFRRQFNQKISSRGTKKQQVYSMAIQFFRLTAKGTHS